MRQPIPMSEVQAWLAVNQPQLEVVRERDWLWCVTSLAGPEHAAEREAIKTMLDGNGFRFAKKGHVLPDGRVSYWGHACDHPISFRKGQKKTTPADQGVIYNKSDWDAVKAEAMAFLGETVTA